MACIFADLDGCTFEWGSNTFLPGALEQLKAFYRNGNEIVFTTQRDDSMVEFTSLGSVEKLLKYHFPNCIVLFGLTSPRIVINDAGAIAINHPQNAPWNYNLIEMAD